MAKHKSKCPQCGGDFWTYDAAPQLYCTVGCAADARAADEEREQKRRAASTHTADGGDEE